MWDHTVLPAIGRDGIPAFTPAEVGTRFKKDLFI